MAKGRNTTVIPVRLSDKAVAQLKARAAAKGVGYTILARQLLMQKLGL